MSRILKSELSCSSKLRNEQANLGISDLMLKATSKAKETSFGFAREQAVSRSGIHRNRTLNRQVREETMNVRCLAMDYDGTISPIEAARSESHVSAETRMVLRRIAKILPVLILTTKDMHFIRARTPFAHAWSAIGGFETKIDNGFLEKASVGSALSSISEALDYVKSQAEATGIETEKKKDSEGHTIAFCIDWRRAVDPEEAKNAADGMAAYAEALGLTVFEYENQPFYDVYPTAPNKGKALQRILREMNVKEGVMYLGDSETDNSAFEESDFAVGVTHGENSPENLQCDFLVEFKDVPKLLRALITNNFQFKPDSPLFKLSRNRSRREMISHARKKGFTNAIGREGFSVPRG